MNKKIIVLIFLVVIIAGIGINFVVNRNSSNFNDYVSPGSDDLVYEDGSDKLVDDNDSAPSPGGEIVSISPDDIFTDPDDTGDVIIVGAGTKDTIYFTNDSEFKSTVPAVVLDTFIKSVPNDLIEQYEGIYFVGFDENENTIHAQAGDVIIDFVYIYGTYAIQVK